MSEFEDRLRDAMAKKGIRNFSELARAAKIARGSIYKWIERGEIPNGRTRQDVANALKVSTDWLRTGEGPMDAPDAVSDTELEAIATNAEDMVLESISFASRFIGLFEVQVSDRGQMALALHYARLRQSTKSTSITDVPPASIGMFIQVMLQKIQSGEIK